ncbi:MAG: hypothetical protein DWQ01_07850 [Planctomycetota bacterium]|nr:MAG: hypothetical protein DWQ01_07850 [Planctomycetota bacterium]
MTSIRSFRFRASLVLAALLSATPGISAQNFRLNDHWDFQSKVLWAKDGGRSLSGLSWCQERRSFFAVGDDGWLVEFDIRGKQLRELRIPGDKDFEGVVAIYKRNQILALEEISCSLHPFSLDKWRASPPWKAPEMVPRAKKGGEGLLWLPPAKPGMPEEIWIGHQGTEMVYVLELDKAGKPNGKVRILKVKDEFRGMAWFPAGSCIMAIADDNREIRAVRRDGTTLDQIPWPRGLKDLEGIAVDDLGNLYLVVDGGGIYQFAAKKKAAGKP